MSGKDCSCPHCKSETSLVDYWTLFVSIEEWPSALLVLSVVGIVSRLLMLSPALSALFAALSLIPVVFLITRKKSCIDCGIEFDELAPVAVRSSRRSDYERF